MLFWFFSASTPLELNKILQRNFSIILDWYADKRLILNVKKTKIMLSGSMTMLLKFDDFDFSPEGGQIDFVSTFKSARRRTGPKMELENTC